MDILVSRNLERLLLHASNGDAALVGQLMSSLSQSGFYRVPDSLLEVIRADFAYGFADDAATKLAIAEAWTSCHRLIDPHTAVAYAVAQKSKGDNPMVIVSTASPFKFSKDVLLAIDPKVEASGLTGFDFMDRLATLSSLAAPKALSALREMPVLHPAVIDVKAMQTFVNDASQKDF